MDTTRKHVAIVLAGGSGTRMGSECPKQFLRLGGRTVLGHAVTAFVRHPAIDEIVVVAPVDRIDEVRQMAADEGWTKVTHIVPGGRERHESTLAALRLYAGADVNLLFHDAARPLVGADIITRVIDALREAEAVGTAVPVVDTIVETTDGCATGFPRRDILRRMQTPQGFRREILERAYQHALADPAFHTTDDCGVVWKYLPGTAIRLVEGDERNMKLTYPGDLLLLERYLSGEETNS